jgi:hypothetical protein
MIRLQTVISNADFYVLNADENCQMRWQKRRINKKGNLQIHKLPLTRGKRMDKCSLPPLGCYGGWVVRKLEPPILKEEQMKSGNDMPNHL